MRPSSSSAARAILLQQATALAACAERLESDPDGYDRALDILYYVLEGEPYAPSLSDDVLDLPEATIDRPLHVRQRARRRGKLILSGVGKSGHIARKVTATLQSTGSMAVFLHPTEALHGDLGVIAEGDALVVFSHSGRSDELLALVKAVRQRGGYGYPLLSPPPSPDNLKHVIPIIVICGDAASPLGLAADAFIDAGVSSESDPHVPAPTASTTLAVAMGDCIALELARRRGFGSKDFAKNHPGGNLGRMLST
jgi:arabinose-5-phosphate isomerase